MSLELCILLWIPAIGLILSGQWSRTGGGCGLTIAYLVYLSMNHLFGAAMYLFPWSGQNEPATTLLGFQAATTGIWGFAVGGLLATLAMPARTRAAKDLQLPETRLIVNYLLAGIASFMLLRLLGSVATVTAALAGGQQLVVPALGLGCWRAWRRRNTKELGLWLTSLLLLPFFTIVTLGFIGYGIGAALTVLTFVATFIRPRRYILPAAVCLAYLGLSLWVTYARDRVTLRDRIWAGEGFGRRVEQLGSTVADFEWLSLDNPLHMQRIDDRLNQNFLAGRAVLRLNATGAFANGETLADGAVALIPRALWPEKPTQAGSGNLVTRYTGITFSQGTSVGIGHVMEFYINFGTTGVILGMGLFGAILTILDQKARASLYRGNYQRFFLFYTPALGFVQVGGSIVELTGTVGATLGIVWFISKLKVTGARRKRSQTVSPAFASEPRIVEA